MSLTPGATGTGPPQQGISDVVSQDDLTRWAQLAGVLQYFTEPVPQPPAPTSAVPMAVTSSNATFTNLYAQLKSMGVPSIVAYIWAAFWASLLGVLGVLVGAVVRFIAALLTPLAVAAIDGIGELRKGVDPAVGVLAQSVLSEFLGADVSTTDLPMGLGGGDHISRARAIGSLLYGQLESEFISVSGGTVQPSLGPAQSFSGLAVNFGLASGILGVIGGMVPSQAGHYEELRELGEEVATNIGLGRLVRRALTPLITTLVSNPAQWAINQKYLPTQFKEAELVNPFLANTLDQPTLYRAMNLLGYSNDKIEAFIKMHQKRLSPADLKLLVDHGQWTQQQAETYTAQLGYPQELQPTVLTLEELKEERGWINKLVDELETEVHLGRLTIDEFTSVVNGLPYSQATRDIILGTVQYKVKAGVKLRPHLLSGGELFHAFAAGLITASDLTDRWNNLGLPQADQDVRLQLWLLQLNRLKELETLRQNQYNEKVKAFGEKQAGQKPGPLLPLPPVPPFPLG